MTRTQIEKEILWRQEALGFLRQDLAKASTPKEKLVLEGLIEEVIEEIYAWKRTPEGLFYDDSASASLRYH
jgi:hypothetical protein